MHNRPGKAERLDREGREGTQRKANESKGKQRKAMESNGKQEQTEAKGREIGPSPLF
jgi:hypothetical protein